MGAPWYFVHSDQVRGPVGLPELVELYGRGIVTEASPVWREGESEWRALGAVEELVLAVKRPGEWRVGAQPGVRRQHMGSALPLA